MSSVSPELVAEIIEIASTVLASNYIVVAISALLVFEWIITFREEIDLFWLKKAALPPKILFILNRYAPLVYFLSTFSGSHVTTNRTCTASVFISVALDNLQYIPWALFSCLRIYATCGKRWELAVVVAFFSAIPIAINLTHFHWDTGVIAPIYGCTTTTTVSPSLSFIFTIISRTSLIVSDIIVVAATWFYTYRSAVSDYRGLSQVPSFAKSFLINGCVYFVILLVLNSLHLTFSLLSIATDGAGGTSFVVSFTEPITAILISRFMLDLQRIKVRTQNQFSSGSLSEVSFHVGEGVLGSLESTLQPADIWLCEDPYACTGEAGAAASPIHHVPKAGDVEVELREASIESRFSYDV